MNWITQLDPTQLLAATIGAGLLGIVLTCAGLEMLGRRRP